MFRVRPPLEILRNSLKPFSEAATGGAPQKVFFKHFKVFTGKHLCWGLFFNKVASHQPCNFIKTETPKQIFLVIIGKFTITPNLRKICERLHWKFFCKNIFQIRTQERGLLMKKMFTYSVKGCCSKQSRLNKVTRLLGEERKDLILYETENVSCKIG